MKHQLHSKTISLRLVNENDASYILSLREDNQYNKFLSPVNINLQEQIDWIKKYKEREKNSEEFYFIIQKNDGKECGTIRLYDIKNNSFCWGSWILDENKTKTAAIESALLIYKLGFDILNYSRSHFDVRKDNVHVISFHEKFNAKRISEDDLNYYYEIYPSDLEIIKEKYSRYTI